MIYLRCPLGDQGIWAFHKICKKCYLGLHNWLNKRSSPISFAVPMIWRKPKDNCKDCNFYLIKTKGFFFKQRDKIAYPNSDKARTPVLHDESMPLPVPLKMGLMLLIAMLMKTIPTFSFLPTLQILSMITQKIPTYFYWNI